MEKASKQQRPVGISLDKIRSGSAKIAPRKTDTYIVTQSYLWGALTTAIVVSTSRTKILSSILFQPKDITQLIYYKTNIIQEVYVENLIDY